MKLKNIFKKIINENSKVIGSYIQYAIGYNKDNISKKDIQKAITDLQKVDDEHGAFWVGMNTQNLDEVVLETTKNKEIYFHLNDKYGTYYFAKLNEWNEIENCFYLLLNEKVKKIEVIMIENNAIKANKDLINKDT